MTDEEIVQDLEACSCDTLELALDLIKRQQAEIERFLIDPTGKFLIGCFEGDAGICGRKIVVDAYQFAEVI